MNSKPMKILIIEDDINDCNNFVNCVRQREDIEIVAITDSDVEALKYVRLKHPEGIVLDLELNHGGSGNADAIDFLSDMKKLKLNYEPIVIVTTHINSKRTYEVLHRDGADLILYKDHPKYSSEYVLNKFINLRSTSSQKASASIEDLTTYYTAKVNYETGVPTPMEFIYYYVDRIKKLV